MIRCISKSASNFCRASSAATAVAALAPSWSLATAQKCLKAWSLARRRPAGLAFIVSITASGRHLNSFREPGAVVSVRPMKPCCRVRAWFVADLFCWLGLFSRRDVEAFALFATKSSNCQRSFHTRSRYPQRIQVAPQSQAEKQVGLSGLSGPLWASLGSSLVTARFTKVHKVMHGMCRRLEKYIHTYIHTYIGRSGAREPQPPLQWQHLRHPFCGLPSFLHSLLHTNIHTYVCM